MKLKGLAETIKKLEAMQEVISKKIDDLYDEPPQWEEKDEFYNHAWMEIDASIELLKGVQEMKMEDYL